MVKVTIIKAQVAQPSGAVKRQGGDGGRKGGGGLQWVI